jgi:hypothetical protein
LEGVGNRSRVGVVKGTSLAVSALAVAQRAARELAAASAHGRSEFTLRPPEPEDADLVAAPPPESGRWSVVVDDMWGWYTSSPLVRVLEVPGPNGCRALVQIPATPLEPVRLVGWRPRQQGFRSAILLLRAAGRLARRSSAPTLRFQPWAAEAGNGGLDRACRLLGLVPRADQTTLWVRTHDPELARTDAVVPTPLFYLGF